MHEKFQRPGLTEDEIEEIKYAFRLFDEKGHGSIKL
jgi:Ca2+-binding EF-hand superfamily protein